jgi:RHS repeat-associated protein
VAARIGLAVLVSLLATGRPEAQIELRSPNGSMGGYSTYGYQYQFADLVIYVLNYSQQTLPITVELLSCGGTLDCADEPIEMWVEPNVEFPEAFFLGFMVGSSGGTATYKLTTSGGGMGAYFDVDVGVLGPLAYLGITPLGSVISVPPNATRTQSFNIHYSGIGGTVAVVPDCGPGILNCSVSPSQVMVSEAPPNPDKSFPVTLTYTTGPYSSSTPTIGVRATHQGAGVVKAGGITAVWEEVLITPSVPTRTTTPGTTDSVQFTIKNYKSTAGSYDLSAACESASTSNCLVMPSVVTVPALGSATAWIKYASGMPSSTGVVQLKARASASTTALPVTGAMTLSVQNTLGVEVETVNPGTAVERSYCVAVSAGAGAGYECGDLRLVHGLPVTQAMSADRSPTLLYNSQHATPVPVVAANVWLPTGVSQTDSVMATLRVKASTATTWTTRATGAWTTSGWTGGQARRIALGFDAASDPTGSYDYTLEVKQGSSTVTKTGKLVIVNRASSPFGSGWWMAGIERLVQEGNSFLWVGGDGSTRLFEPGTPANPTTWKATHPDMAGVDSIRKITVGTQVSYVHDLPDKTKVYYSATGLQDSTVSRLGHRTSFEYDSYGRLSKILLPAPSGITRQEYVISWPAGGVVGNYTITAPPPVNPVSRTTKVALTTLTGGGGRIRYIQDPDSPSDTLLSTRFSYPNTTSRLVSSRTDKRGTRNSYSYTPVGSRFTTLVADTGTNRLNIRSDFSPLEVLGLKVGTAAAPKGTPIALTSAMTMILGPVPVSPTLRDTTRIWTDRWGAPTVIRDVLGNETRLFREDASFPALVTEVRASNGYTTRAVFNGKGAPIRTTQINPYGDGRDAVTSYEYSDVLHPFLPTKVTQPEGDFVQMAYLVNGNTSWVQDGRGTASRVSFAYIPSGCAGLTSRVTESATAADSTHYDYDDRCNLRRVVTPLGTVTTIKRDLIGRVDSIYTPIDGTRRGVQNFVYDLMDRVKTTVHYGPSMDIPYTPTFANRFTGGQARSPEEWTLTTNVYDAVGNLLSVSTEPAASESWVYDALGRPTSHSSQTIHNTSPIVTLTHYDPAGNPVKVKTATGDSILMNYDRLGRLKERIIPAVTTAREQLDLSSTYFTSFPVFPNAANGGLTIPSDTETFLYDNLGNLVKAVNRDATVIREYYPNGALRKDSTIVAGLAVVGAMHGLRYEYDRNGRRTALHQNGGVKQSYTWSPTTGELTSIQDVLGKNYLFSYTAHGELKTIAYPNGVTETREYDLNGRLKNRSGGPGGMLNASFTYDQRGKVLGDYYYSGLGYLLLTEQNGTEVEQMVTDPLGNLLYRFVNQRQYDDGMMVDRPFIVTQTGHDGNTTSDVDFMYCSNTDGNCSYPPQTGTSTTYDAAGNERVFATETWQRPLNNSQPAVRVGQSRSQSWYGADGKLRYTQRVVPGAFCPTGVICPGVPVGMPQTIDGEFVEYRYDALGRRVRTITRRDDDLLCRKCGDKSSELFVWDGDQLLLEVRDSITVRYTHGLGIDQPLSLIRNGKRVIPHTNVRGLYFDFTDDTGVRLCPPTKLCSIAVLGSALKTSSYRTPLDPSNLRSKTWYGSLVMGSTDPNGLMYRRNRYYNPETGRFTQMDPIGIAGGLNVYGYANGDPVNFSDPFGLCPVEDTDTENCPDDAIKEAYMLLEQIGRGDVIQALVDSKTTSVNIVDRFGPTVGGSTTYSGKKNVPTINLNVNGWSTIEIAANLSHEVWHATYGAVGESLAEESDAFIYGMATYLMAGGRGTSKRWDSALRAMERGPESWSLYIKNAYPKFK